MNNIAQCFPEPIRASLSYIAVFSAVILTYLVKIRDDLIEQPETLDALVVEVQLRVELVEVGDGGEDDAHALVGLAV